jgi:hypothetical protein
VLCVEEGGEQERLSRPGRGACKEGGVYMWVPKTTTTPTPLSGHIHVSFSTGVIIQYESAQLTTNKSRFGPLSEWTNLKSTQRPWEVH